MEQPELFIQLAMAFLGIFLMLSFADGVYLHLIRFRLQERPDSRSEHLMHTLRAMLFVPIVVLLFLLNVSGPWLWILTAIVLADLVIEAVDILEERRSRLRIGGLTSGEYLLHILETTFRVAAYVLAYTVKPVEAWFADIHLQPYPSGVCAWATLFTVGAAAIALLHIILIPFPFFISRLLGNRGRDISV